MFVKFILTLLLPFCFGKSIELTFHNVTFVGYGGGLFTERIEKTIQNGNRLKDFLPVLDFDFIQIEKQNIPILYKDSLADLGDLDELLIEFCEIEEIKPGALSNVPLLKKLFLRGNNLQSIEEGVFNNLKIIYLDLSSNRISHIHPQALDDLPELKIIDLADNLIQKWNPEWLKNTPLLTTISVRNNSIEELPANSFKNMKGKNKLRGMTFVFGRNKIRTIDPAAFSGLNKIKSLWLDDNFLKDFNENLLDGIEIDDLHLEYNKIKCFQGDLEKILKAKTNHIDSNPFDCNCVDRIVEWSWNNQNLHIHKAHIKCIIERLQLQIKQMEKKLSELNEKH